MYLSLLIFIISIISLVIGSLAYTERRTPSLKLKTNLRRNPSHQPHAHEGEGLLLPQGNINSPPHHPRPPPPAPPQKPVPVPTELRAPFYIALENAFPQIKYCMASKIMGPGSMAEVEVCIPKDKPGSCDQNSWTLLAYPEVSKNVGTCFDEKDATSVCIKKCQGKNSKCNRLDQSCIQPCMLECCNEQGYNNPKGSGKCSGPAIISESLDETCCKYCAGTRRNMTAEDIQKCSNRCGWTYSASCPSGLLCGMPLKNSCSRFLKPK